MLSLPLDDLMSIIISQLGKPNFRPAFLQNFLDPIHFINADGAMFYACLQGINRLTVSLTAAAHDSLEENADFVLNSIIKWIITLLAEMPPNLDEENQKNISSDLHYHLYRLASNPSIPPLFGDSPFVAEWSSVLVDEFMQVHRVSDYRDSNIDVVVSALSEHPRIRSKLCDALRRQPRRLLFRSTKKLERVSDALKANPDMSLPVHLVMNDLFHAGTIGFVDAELRKSLRKRNSLDSVVTIASRVLDTLDLSTSGVEDRDTLLGLLRMLFSLHDSRGYTPYTPYLRIKGWVQSLDAGLVEVIAKVVRLLGDYTCDSMSNWMRDLLVDLGVYTICSRRVAIRASREVARVIEEDVDRMGGSRMTDDSTSLKRSWAVFLGIVQKVTRLDPQTGAVSLICMNPKVCSFFWLPISSMSLTFDSVRQILHV